MPKSSFAKKSFARNSSLNARDLHTLFAQMAKEAEELAAQVARLRALHKTKRVTYQTIADAIGVSGRTVQAWHALTNPTDVADRHLVKLAAYYGVSADFIEYGVDGREASAASAPEAEEPIPLDLARVRRSLKELENQIRLLRAETAERDAEVLKQIGQLRPPNH